MFDRTPRLATTLATVLLSASALLLTGCSDNNNNSTQEQPRPDTPGCTKDTDCKGDRICRRGHCTEDRPHGDRPRQVAATNDTPTPPPPATPNPPQDPTPQPAPAPAADPYAMGNDGLPVTIPPPGSQVPTVAEWAAVPREITLRGSGTLGCETKMLREWLRVSCRLHGDDIPIEVRKESASSDVQVFVFQGAGVSSLVTQVVRGREVHAAFAWSTHENHWGAMLHVTWPSGNPRPTMALVKDTY